MLYLSHVMILACADNLTQLCEEIGGQSANVTAKQAAMPPYKFL
jgi:hypothetical protein